MGETSHECCSFCSGCLVSKKDMDAPDIIRQVQPVQDGQNPPFKRNHPENKNQLMIKMLMTKPAWRSLFILSPNSWGWWFECKSADEHAVLFWLLGLFNGLCCDGLCRSIVPLSVCLRMWLVRIFMCSPRDHWVMQILADMNLSASSLSVELGSFIGSNQNQKLLFYFCAAQTNSL